MTLKDKKGFTLIEVLIVIMIIAVLAVAGTPQLMNLLRSHRLSGATRVVWGDLHRARMMAIKEGRVIRLDFTATSYTLVRVGTPGVAFQRDLSSVYPGVTVSIQNNTVSFGSTGTAGGGSKTLQIQSPAGTKNFTILTTGRIGNIS